MLKKLISHKYITFFLILSFLAILFSNCFHIIEGMRLPPHLKKLLKTAIPSNTTVIQEAITTNSQPNYKDIIVSCFNRLKPGSDGKITETQRSWCSNIEGETLKRLEQQKIKLRTEMNKLSDISDLIDIEIALIDSKVKPDP